ncbi:MAG: hypothetical protein JXQ77_03780 [Campylobacterales bacterium]|nr:hypothetical protein [Campylobacterales bacterium]
MHIYTYNADIGTFEIRQTGHKRYELWIDDEILGTYENAEFAAEDVARFNTGYTEWDRWENELENYPANLSEWSKVGDEFQE